MSSRNEIISNNFKRNNRHTKFLGCYNNYWNNNYWGKPLNYPKLILGRIGLLFFLIPWINIDWHPAKQPYNYTSTQGCGIT
jgi:hypothetical protein